MNFFITSHDARAWQNETPSLNWLSRWESHCTTLIVPKQRIHFCCTMSSKGLQQQVCAHHIVLWFIFQSLDIFYNFTVKVIR